MVPEKIPLKRARRRSYLVNLRRLLWHPSAPAHCYGLRVAINHYIEANQYLKAIEASINSRQWAKAVQVHLPHSNV